MIERQQSGGARQKAWDKLRGQDWESTKALADAIGCESSGLRAYIAALETRGYVDRQVDGSLRLVHFTGPRAPSFNVRTGDFRDWNVDPSMTGIELEALIKKTGLSIHQWLLAAGMKHTLNTRLRQMINGQRPVGPSFAKAAQHLADGSSAA